MYLAFKEWKTDRRFSRTAVRVAVRAGLCVACAVAEFAVPLVL